jgi:hypothetical protein
VIKNAIMATMTNAEEADEMECYEEWEELNFHQSNMAISPAWTLSLI